MEELDSLAAGPRRSIEELANAAGADRPKRRSRAKRAGVSGAKASQRAGVE